MRLGVNPEAIVKAQLRSRQADDVLASLLETGHLEPDNLARLTRERVLSSLLPLVWRSALVQVSGAADHAVLPLTSADVMQSVSAAERHAG